MIRIELIISVASQVVGMCFDSLVIINSKGSHEVRAANKQMLVRLPDCVCVLHCFIKNTQISL